jgi:hypothetical protein
MPRFQGDDAISSIIAAKSGKKADKETIYIFRCDESGLYAFTSDREGRMLPSQIYPRLHWRFEQAITVSVTGILPATKSSKSHSKALPNAASTFFLRHFTENC